MNTRSLCSTLLLVALCVTAAGCGDDGATRFPKLSKAANLQYESTHLAVGFRHGETVQLEPGSADGGVLGEARGVFDHAFLHVGVYDEYAPTFGEYFVYPSRDSGARGASFFDSERAAGRFEPRAADLYGEVTEAMGKGSFADFESYSLVLDFWRVDGSWYVPWDGKMDRAADSFGLYRDDMRQEVLEQIKNAAKTHQPRYFIIGSDMERLLGTETGEPLSETEYANFVAFYRDAVSLIKEVAPDTKVGAGINWDRFYTHVAPRYGASAGTDAEGPVSNEDLAAAFEAAVLPLVEAGDIVALKSYTTPEDAQPQAYQFLRRLGDLYGVNQAVVWYSIGSPAPGRSGYSQQQTYLEDFAEWNAGVDAEMVAWRALVNIDGADAGSGNVTGRCAGLTGEANGFGAPESLCFDGLFTSIFQSKPAFDHLESAVE